MTQRQWLASPLAEGQRRQSSDAFVRIRACALIAALCRYGLQQQSHCLMVLNCRRRLGVIVLPDAFSLSAQELWRHIEGGAGRAIFSACATVYHEWQYDELAQLVRVAMRGVGGMPGYSVVV